MFLHDAADRGHCHLAAVLEFDLEAALDGRLEALHDELPVVGALGARSRLGPARLRVPHVEEVVAAALDEVRLAQEAAGVRPNQQREVGLLAHVGEVEVAALPDVAGGRQAECGVRARANRQPGVGVDRGRAVLRIDHGELGAVVPGFVEEVGVRDLRHRRVHHPDDREVGEKPLVAGATHVGKAQGERGADVEIADLGPVVGEDAARLHLELEAPHRGGAQIEVRTQILVDGVGAVLLGDGHHLLGDLLDRLLPADALPLAAAPLAHALHGDREPARAVHQLRVAGALLAAARIEVRHAGFGGLVPGALLLANDDPVFHVEVPGAGAPAVGPAVGALGDRVPGPALAVEIFPASELRGCPRGVGLGRAACALRRK